MFLHKHIWLFISGLILFGTLMYTDYIVAKNNYLNEKFYDLNIQYQSYLSTRKSSIDLLAEKVINDPKVGEILYNAKNSPDQIHHQHNALYEYLSPYFRYLKQKGINLFYLHDDRGTVFLRLHNPELYGDSQSKRFSIAQIVREHKPIFGLESGLHFDEFRYIYPIFYKGKYVGSIELSLSPKYLINDMNAKLDGAYTLLSSYESIKSRLNHPDQKHQYTQSWIEGYYIHNDLRKNHFSDQDLKILSTHITHKLHNNQPLSLPSTHLFAPSYIYTFLPIQNIEKEPMGYLISQRHDETINHLILTQIVKFLIISGLLFLALWVFRTLQQRQSRSEHLLEQYKYAMDQALIVSKTDPQGHITYVNPLFCDISGYRENELIGHSHNIVRHPDSSDPFFRQMWKTILAKKMWKGVIKNRSKNGKEYYVQSTITPILDDQNEIAEFIALREDITEQIHRKNLLQAEKDQFASLFDNIDEILLFIQDNHIKQISQKFFELFEFDNLYDFIQRHSCICELFIVQEGYLHAAKNRSEWITTVLEYPNQLHKALLRDKNGTIHTFRVKVKKIPEDNSFVYLISLSDISLLVPLPEDLVEKAPPMAADLTLWYSNLQERLKLPLHIIETLIETFIANSTESIQKLIDAIDAKEYTTIELISHNLKGSSSTLRLDEIATLSSDIETSARNHTDAGMGEKAQSLKALINDLVTHRTQGTL